MEVRAGQCKRRNGKKFMPLSYERRKEFYEYPGQRGEQTSVLEDVKPKRSIEAAILQLKLHYFDHVMRAKGSLEWDIMLGQVAGYRRQGKTRMRWLDSIKEATSLHLEALKETVQDRKK
jgi:hypothetical protein